MEIYLEQNLIELRGYQDDNAEIVDVLLYAAERAGMLPPYFLMDGKHLTNIKSYLNEKCVWEPEEE